MSWINKKITEYYKSKHQKVFHRPIPENILNVFKESGEGLYYVALKSRENNLVAKIITFLTGKYSHVVTVLYSDDMENSLCVFDRMVVTAKLNYFYLNPPALRDIQLLVLASADSDGMNYFDFSHYCLRHFNIFKVREQFDELTSIRYAISRFCRSYDATGLFGFCLGLFDDETSDYCSEIVQQIFKAGGAIVFDRGRDASPTEINGFGIKVCRLRYGQ